MLVCHMQVEAGCVINRLGLGVGAGALQQVLRARRW